MTAVGEEQRALDGGTAEQGSEMGIWYCSERRWAEWNQIRIWIEVERRAMDSAKLDVFNFTAFRVKKLKVDKTGISFDAGDGIKLFPVFPKQYCLTRCLDAD